MPQGLISLLPLIFGGVGAATSVGEAIAGAVSGSPTQPTPTTPPGPTPPSPQALAQQRALVTQQYPNVVGATSGLASPSYDSLISQILAGVVGQPGANAAGNAAAGFAPGTGQSFSAVNSQPSNAATNAAVQGQPSLSIGDFLQ